MKWIRRLLLGLVVLVVGIGAAVVWKAMRTERRVGFQLTRATDSNGQPFTVGIWYPTQARTWPTTQLGLNLMDVAADGPVAGNGLPLVVLSHGNAGGPGSHADLALALADAGYVVAAPMHSGDNYADQSAAGTVAWLGGRNRQLRLTLDYMLKSWPGHAHLNPARVGAFGFSAGGITVLTAVGAQPDLRLIAGHCAESPEFICTVLREGNSPLLDPDKAKEGNTYAADPRIRAAVVAAPGLGFTLGPGALAAVRVPVQLWSGEQDTVVSYATNTKRVREALGSGAEFHSVPGAEHFSFLTPCGLLAPPLLCTDPGQFDRKAFHLGMNASVIAFFDKNIR
ncbi:alpha/beta hydrolase family protein [Hymenobacter persicinus]|uniref:Dienelactone hydrolase n=1 Tax=Hymenobacter persicinus TaxID=2025506 RepID=A0A4Q5LCQ8_9BACT|nr:dienelactone hydrolase [Hymenobacter persicinus]RYU81007.1 dienelactone hydrolase [Hymenobacter persicinus]